ncbi:MAG: DUF3306 domain-containing protein [Chromatiales bacterium]|jgi:hypothetical protein|nr:DUF3306 domain-containing protein [Chromatiales bacterium]MDH4031409.1 DUF3306 domain-containing protein [Chromatiales bacterium]
MIEKNERGPSQDTPAVTEDEDFLSRWSRRKIDAGQEDDDPVLPQDAGAAEPVEADEEPVVLTDEDMPPLEALDDDADYSAFLSSGVSEQLRKQALRKLFHAAKFNICDGLDDYADDYTKFEPLGDVITADMKFEMEQAMKKAMAAENDETAADESGAPAEEVTAEADTLADGTTTEQPGQDEEAGPEEDENARPA